MLSPATRTSPLEEDCSPYLDGKGYVKLNENCIQRGATSVRNQRVAEQEQEGLRGGAAKNGAAGEPPEGRT